MFDASLDQMEALVLQSIEAEQAEEQRQLEEKLKCPLGLSLQEFKVAFVPQFLATMCANRFNDYCARGIQEKITDLPFEDAEFCAEETYEKYYKFKN